MGGNVICDLSVWITKFKLGQLVFKVLSTQVHTEGANDNGKKYVSYELNLFKRTEDTPFDETAPRPIIHRRYTDFLQLYERLKKDYPQHLAGLVFPKKCFTGNFTSEVICLRINCFEDFLNLILTKDELRDSDHFLRFLQDQELERACRLLDERRREVAIPILHNCFLLLNKIFTDCSKPVLLVLCRIVDAHGYSIVVADVNKWIDLALRRFERVCDADLLALYIPLIRACQYLSWKTGQDNTHQNLTQQLEAMKKRGFNTASGPTLQQAIHKLDPRTETA